MYVCFKIESNADNVTNVYSFVEMESAVREFMIDTTLDDSLKEWVIGSGYYDFYEKDHGDGSGSDTIRVVIDMKYDKSRKKKNLYGTNDEYTKYYELALIYLRNEKIESLLK